MKYLIVADWDDNNIVIVENFAADEAEAITIRDTMIGAGHSEAFYVLNPGGRHSFKVVDPVAKTVTFNQAGYDAKVAMGVWGHLRTERDSLLVSSDWTQYNDSPLSDEVKTEWATYRETLRNLPANSPDPSNPTWPDAPE